MKTLLKYEEDKKANEIFQSLNIKFSFVTTSDEKTYKQITAPIKCRDFLGDCVWSKKTSQKVSIYNFFYSFDENPYDLETLRLSMTFPNKKSKGFFMKNFDNIMQIDKYLEHSSLFYETDDENTLIVEASPYWQSDVWKISLYTFFLKCLSYKSMECLQVPEKDYFDYLPEQILDRLLSQVVESPKEILYDNIREQHHHSGFVSIIKGSNKEMQELILGNK
ncbi:hypothetical protein [Caudoviricetes sp.]|nr:hypothetical protein [Caudoviricetes sp.]